MFLCFFCVVFVFLCFCVFMFFFGCLNQSKSPKRKVRNGLEHPLDLCGFIMFECVCFFMFSYRLKVESCNLFKP